LKNHIENTLDDEIENVIASQRYGHINAIMKKCVERKVLLNKTLSEKIDSIALHRVGGPFVLLFVLWLFYFIVFRLSEKPIAFMEGLFSFLHNFGNAHLPDGIWRSLLVSGMIDGVGGVLGFTPLIMMMFLVISFLEDSGYMARIAFLLDRVLRFLGMHGNSILA
jgi:ferrous iron transport protein B